MVEKGQFLRKGLLLSLTVLLAACSSRYDESHGGSWRGYSETGLASYYADRYHNKRTASGEPYQRHANTAAHMELPFGAMVRVTNLANGKSVVVRVNDRGNFPRGRIIDLSKAAFSAIGKGGTVVVIGMANPASVYCAKLGGKTRIEKTTTGERGICVLPNGTEIDEWELFRRDHPAK